MSQYIKPNIILLKDGVDSSQGRGQIVSNINACCHVVDIVKSTLGPRGMDKLMHDDGGDTLVTNDGATVMRRLNIVHPAARILCDISRSQDMEIGDGTTSVVVFCGGLLSEAKRFIEDGVVAQTVISGFRKACELSITKLKELSIDLSEKSEEEKFNLLRKCAETTLNSKLVADYKEFFSDMVVRAIRAVGSDLNIWAIGMKKIPGGSVTDSQLITGVAFKKTFSYAGFEQQPKQFDNPKVMLLNIELELKAERDNAEIRIDADQFQSIVDAEWNIIYEKLENIVKTGANVVLSRMAIGDLATQYFADRGIFCAGRVEAGDLERTRRATGAVVQTTVTSGLKPEEVLGTCGRFEEVSIGGERWNLFKDCTESKSATMIIRGGAQQFIDEAERSIHDALMIVKSASKNTAVVGGGGSIELELARFLQEYSKTVPGKTQRVVASFAKALEVIPRTLIQNSGGDATETLNKLRKLHAQGTCPKTGKQGRWMGVDCIDVESGVKDTMESFIWEPVTVKENSISAACEACCLILSIDETIKNPQSEQPKGKGKGGKNPGKGFGAQQQHMLGGGKGKGMRQIKNNMR